MDGDFSLQEMHDVENMLEELVTKFKSKISKKIGHHPISSKYISSNPPSSKKRKHHGCNGYYFLYSITEQNIYSFKSMLYVIGHFIVSTVLQYLFIKY